MSDFNQKDTKQTLFHKLGECLICRKPVFDIQLYVEDVEQEQVFHYSCYNELKKKQVDAGDQ